ncbi:hypothetical protein [Syntrophomonas erecta]
MEIAYSLALSYLLLGTSIGLMVWFTVGRIIDRKNFGASAPKILLVAVVLAVLGVAFATIHLGRMDRFMNLIANPSSWLSREGLFAGAFTACTVLYFLLAKKKEQKDLHRIDPLLYVAVLAGVGTFICMGMIYASTQAIPAWNTTMVVLVDILSGLLMGGLLFLVLAAKEVSSDFLRSITVGVFLVILVSIIINIAYEAQVGMVMSALAARGTAVPSVWLGTLVRVIIGLLVPAYLMAKSFKGQGNSQIAALNIGLICVVIGEIASKMMHFIVAVKGPLF